METSNIIALLSLSLSVFALYISWKANNNTNQKAFNTRLILNWKGPQGFFSQGTYPHLLIRNVGDNSATDVTIKFLGNSKIPEIKIDIIKPLETHEESFVNQKQELRKVIREYKGQILIEWTDLSNRRQKIKTKPPFIL